MRRKNGQKILFTQSGKHTLSNSYYVPDYILKIETIYDTSYFILDAKFSDVSSIKKYHLAEIVYKYIFSISSVNSDDKIKGIYIISGKQFSDNKYAMITNIYNSEYIIERNKNIAPDFKILSLFPAIESDVDDSEHNIVIAKLLKI